MLYNYLNSIVLVPFAMQQSQIVNVLIIVAVFFGILLILGIRKSYKLNKEKQRLEEIDKKLAEEKEKPYRDFTEGHIYGGDN
ncbi:hypothetical protein KFZ70_14015 [Tamlana fucoidanivorans]|uniref:Uncharacterized protein n=1 Tax=Allotamlana fucoidanivorans TaxID=2583814 RepID=A0A5C4SQI5_9FLAO|nr:hypothetical protein [Tamlana fucoidanivorans]TNJ46542.1 hypothetical protein FGF67_02625 [Tamlana fucoidanivorans]